MGHRDNPGGGSVFWLELPSGVADADDIAAAEAVDAAPAEGLRILVVDDSDVNREVAQASLRSAGHTVTAARDGGEAVGLAASQDFDVILMDMLMPIMGGLEATRNIRALGGPRGRVPIVAVTANALDRHAEECRRAGMSEYLAKPFVKSELLAAVSRAAARKKPMPSATQPTNHGDCVKQLGAFMDTDAVERLLDCLALRIESLLRQLDDPYCSASSDAIGSLAHEVAGSAGTLGFTALSSAAKDLQQAIGKSPASVGNIADEVRREAAAVLTELRDRRSLEALSSG
jgi:CheY-like chemotaxis protein/HPt (histidine-containing phosphotransfer) domain-containing protein